MEVLRQHQETSFVQHERNVQRVATQTIETREELDGRLELRRQEEHAEVEERLLVRVEVVLSCDKTSDSKNHEKPMT